MYVKDPFKAWRVLTNTVLIPTIPLMVMIYLMPESPRYLMKHGRYRKALEAFEQIQTTSFLASRDFMYAHAQLDFEGQSLKGTAKEHGNRAERVDLSTPSLHERLPAGVVPNQTRKTHVNTSAQSRMDHTLSLIHI